MTSKPKSFTLANATAPTAEPQPAPPTTPTLPDVPAPGIRSAPGVQAAGDRGNRSAFTWRQSVREQDALDELVRVARRSTGRRVDKAQVLAALVDAALASETIRGTLIGYLAP